jgi:hypothetical protein
MQIVMMSMEIMFYSLPGSLIWYDIFVSLLSIADLCRFDAAITNKKLRDHFHRYIGVENNSIVHTIDSLRANDMIPYRSLMLYGKPWQCQTSMMQVVVDRRAIRWISSRCLQVFGIKISSKDLESFSPIYEKIVGLRRLVYDNDKRMLSRSSYQTLSKGIISKFVCLTEAAIYNIDTYLLQLLSLYCPKLALLAGSSSSLSLIDILETLPTLTKLRVAALPYNFDIVVKNYSSITSLTLCDYGFDYGCADMPYFLTIDRIFPSLLELSLHAKIISPTCTHDDSATPEVDVSILSNLQQLYANKIYGHGLRDLIHSLPSLTRFSVRNCPLLCNYAICKSLQGLTNLKEIILSDIVQFRKNELVELVANCHMLESLQFACMIVPWAPPLKKPSLIPSRLKSLRFYGCDFSLMWSSWGCPSVWDAFMKHLLTLEFNDCRMKQSDIREMVGKVSLDKPFRLMLSYLNLSQRDVFLLRNEFPEARIEVTPQL